MGARGLSRFFEAIEDRDGLDAPLHKSRAATRLKLDVLLEDEYEVAVAAGIRARDFTARPSYMACGYCAFREICPSAWGSEAS